MIIGSILDVSMTPGGVGGNSVNGTTTCIFYTMADAILWAELQSERIVVGPNSGYLFMCTMVINTDTNVRRWWFDGTEYTG